ncbi:MAG: HupE/UreJ family protein [Sphingobacteriaceae bacterium]|nr:HupE/UreJ family protein [Sphingobacteriaceae bacterium]
MDFFVAYLKMGFEHISDIKGYDHMLFIIILCSVYKITEWKKVAILITAFTIGHSTTLALSALKIIITNSALIEVLIPVTILFTSLANLFYNTDAKPKNINYNYWLALIFGFIHGMGFSNFFNALMGDSMNIIYPLFAFNVGLELGQLLIVAMFFALYFAVNKLFKIEQKSWILFISGMGAGISLIMILERIK